MSSVTFLMHKWSDRAAFGGAPQNIRLHNLVRSRNALPRGPLIDHGYHFKRPHEHLVLAHGICPDSAMTSSGFTTFPSFDIFSPSSPRIRPG